ncbi:MAG: L,D-transpeptidase ErfK/SrfK [Candidatus Paceibacteria bacterium]|jgi:L,D-transpeptidase ErfK/SrfK
MRTLILVVLAGGALYFAWGRFSGVSAANPEDDASIEVEYPDESGAGTRGAFMSLADLQETEQVPAVAERPQEEPRPVPTQAAPDPGPETDDSLDLFDLGSLGDPLHEGSLLLHRPDELQSYLNSAGKGLSKSRKKLLIAYLLLANGQYGQVPKYADGLENAQDVTPDELALLRAGMGRKAISVRSASSRTIPSPLILGVSMAFMEREADEAGVAGEWGRAAALLSELLLTEIDAPWQPDNATLKRWANLLKDAQVSHRWSPDGAWPSLEVVVRPGDTLVAIRKRVIAEKPALQICTGLIERSNQLGQYLRENQVLRVPTERVRTIIDLSARWLYYMHGNEVVAAWPVAIGRKGQETTPGRYQTGEKTPEPPWFPRGRDMVPYGDKDNPLGTRWITLDGSDSLGIHGTWLPESIGSMASDGCIRLRNEDVEALFEILPKGSEVWVRP